MLLNGKSSEGGDPNLNLVEHKVPFTVYHSISRSPQSSLHSTGESINAGSPDFDSARRETPFEMALRLQDRRRFTNK